MRTQIEAALAAGLTELCFTDHYDPCFPYETNPELVPGTFELELSSYREEFLSLRDEFSGRIRLHYGVELGLIPGIADQLNAYVDAHPEFEFIIGSVHVMDGLDPYYPAAFAGRSEEQVYRRYFEIILQCVREFSRFQTMGHLDYIVRYGPNQDREYSYAKYRDVIDPILAELVRNGIALELNTAPLKKGCRECNPASDILIRYRELGGEHITVGSDAHVPENVAGNFAVAEDVLRRCGYQYYTVFENKRPMLRSLTGR